MSRYRDKLRKAFSKENYLIAILVAIIVFGAVLYLFSDRFTFMDLLFEILISIGAAAITIMFVDLHHKNESDAMMKEMVKEILLVEHDSLTQHYSTSDNKRIIGNCLDVLCSQEMSESFMGFLNSNLQTARKDFSYSVDLCPMDAQRNEIKQSINYIRMFRTEGKTDFKVKCLFALENGMLDSKLNDKTYFFREEIDDDEFVGKLRKDIESAGDDNTKIAEIVCSALNLSLSMKRISDNKSYPKVEIPTSDLNVFVLDNCGGIVIEYNIPNEFLHFSEDLRQCQYRAYLSCSYPMSKENHFYCVFSEPTIGHTSFSIDFNSVVKNVKKDVHYQTFLSSYTPVNNEMTDFISDEIEHLNDKIVFKTDKTIYPRSGIVFMW